MFDPDTFYRPKDAKLRQFASVQTLANWRHQRRGPKYRKLGKCILYLGADLNEWLAAELREPEAA